MQGRKARLVAREAHRKTGRLLDIGTGTGYFSDTMVRRGWKVEAVEKSPQAREFAKLHFDLDVKPESALKEFAPDSFDVITLWHVMEHLEHLDEVWQRLHELLTEKGVLITGSNASGKSTFLKTVAMNAIFAQTIHTCMADSYSAGLYRIMSSMTLRDDLAGGDSYYIVEIKSLKRILNTVKEDGNPVLCFVDEVLRGTNTVERIAASTQILKSLSKSSVLCFAATHDIELTHLLEKCYNNYHFEEEIMDKDVVFHYRLLKGKATTRNAIKLLGVMGYDENIIQEAETLAEKFLEEGSWG